MNVIVFFIKDEGYKCVLIYKYQCEVLILNENFTFEKLKYFIEKSWMLRKGDYVLTDMNGRCYGTLFTNVKNYSKGTVVNTCNDFDTRVLIVHVMKRDEKFGEWHTACDTLSLSKV